MATNNFKPFATGNGANVTTQTDYESLPALATGFQAGKASSAQINKALRQSTTIAAVIAQFMADTTGTDVLDNGAQANLIAQFKAALSTATTGRLINVQAFSSSGTYMPTSGTKYVIVEAVGGGGAGGGAPATGAGAVSVGGGGTAGSYGKGRYTSAFSGVMVTVGAGGGAVLSETGGTGGDSSFGTLLTARGGNGGIRKGPSNPNFGVTGGAIGGGTQGTNIMSASGAPGGFSLATSLTSFFGGVGAPSVYGGGGTLNTVNTNGVDGTAPGSGGSGAFQGENQSTGRSGGSGAKGLVIVWEYA